MLFFKNIVSQSGNTCYHAKGSTDSTNRPSPRLWSEFFTLFNAIWMILHCWNKTKKPYLVRKVGSGFSPLLSGDPCTLMSTDSKDKSARCSKAPSHLFAGS